MRVDGFVKIRLRTPIELAQDTVPAISPSPLGQWVHSMTIEPVVSERRVRALVVQFTVDDPGVDVEHNAFVFASTPAGEEVVLEPGEIAWRAVRSFLRTLAELSLQVDVVQLEDKAWHVEMAEWRTPAGVPFKKPREIFSATWHLPGPPNPNQQRVDLATWNTAASSTTVLWKAVLLDGYRALWRGDLRTAVLHAATSLDVGIQHLLPPNRSVSVEVFRGGVGRIPDLRTLNASLASTLAALWYSRHGVVHHASSMIFLERPSKPGVTPQRPITEADVRLFLAAVPMGIQFVETNPA